MSDWLNLSYGRSSYDRIDAFTPPSLEPTPAVILIHGGAWRSGDKSQFESPSLPYINEFEANGVACFALNYPIFPEMKWGGMIMTIERAVAWIKNRAHLFNIDPNRIGAFGRSAGGQIAAWLGMHNLVTAVVDQSGPVNLPDNVDTLPGISHVFGHLDGFYSSPVNMPMDHVTTKFLISQGRDDPLVHIQEAMDFFGALRANDINATYQPYDGGHVFNNMEPLSIAQTLAGQVGWLSSRI